MQVNGYELRTKSGWTAMNCDLCDFNDFNDLYDYDHRSCSTTISCNVTPYAVILYDGFDVETWRSASLPETIWNSNQTLFSPDSTPTELMESVVIAPELRFACTGLFTLNAAGVPVRRLFADDVFAANIRKFRRNAMSVADNRKQSENSVRNGMSVANNRKQSENSVRNGMSVADNRKQSGNSVRNDMSVADNRKQSENSVRNDMLITVEPMRHNQTLFSPDSKNKTTSYICTYATCTDTSNYLIKRGYNRDRKPFQTGQDLQSRKSRKKKIIIMKRYLSIKQSAEYSAMESGDHSTNGAIPKSHTSRGNVKVDKMKTVKTISFLIVGIASILIALFAQSCAVSLKGQHAMLSGTGSSSIYGLEIEPQLGEDAPIALKLLMGAGILKVSDDELDDSVGGMSGGLGFAYYFLQQKSRRLQPYVGFDWWSILDDSPNPKSQYNSYTPTAGLRYFISNRIALIGDIGVPIGRSSYFDKSFIGVKASVGISFMMGAK
jgi:hypothetical protein